MDDDIEGDRRIVEEKEGGGDYNDNNMQQLEKIFFELGFQLRMDILLCIHQNKAATLSTIAKELDIEMQEAHRNTKRLADTGFIKRNSQSMFSLTTFGNAIIIQLPTFRFLSRYKQYFSEHTLGILSDKYVRDMGALEKSKFVDGITGVLQVWRAIIESSDQFLYGLVLQLGSDYFELAASHASSKGIRTKYILPVKAKIGNRYFEIEKKYHLPELIAKGILERRVAEKVDVAIVLNEKQACVMFPDSNGLTDFNRAFYGDDKAFYDWCRSYFQYQWDNASFYDKSRFQII